MVSPERRGHSGSLLLLQALPSRGLQDPRSLASPAILLLPLRVPPPIRERPHLMVLNSLSTC